jgi:hypothetical protein
VVGLRPIKILIKVLLRCECTFFNVDWIRVSRGIIGAEIVWSPGNHLSSCINQYI